MNGLVSISEPVTKAVSTGEPVVALETTLVSHGFPHPVGAEVALESEHRVRAAGAVPATVGIVDGAVRVGLSEAEIVRFGADSSGVRKVGPRDLAACVIQRALGGTTVGGTVAVARLTGIRFMATGGIGGVHRGFPSPPDVSADLAELARSPVMVVSAGIKSLLDVGSTMEALETLGVPVLGWRTDRLPLFFTADGGPPVPARVESADEAARIAEAHWQLGRNTALLLARPPSDSVSEVDALIEAALAEAAAKGVSGQAVTPFVLQFVHDHSDGRTAAVNKSLIVDNAGLAAEVAAAFAGAR